MEEKLDAERFDQKPKQDKYKDLAAKKLGEKLTRKELKNKEYENRKFSSRLINPIWNAIDWIGHDVRAIQVNWIKNNIDKRIDRDQKKLESEWKYKVAIMLEVGDYEQAVDDLLDISWDKKERKTKAWKFLQRLTTKDNSYRDYKERNDALKNATTEQIEWLISEIDSRIQSDWYVKDNRLEELKISLQRRNEMKKYIMSEKTEVMSDDLVFTYEQQKQIEELGGKFLISEKWYVIIKLPENFDNRTKLIKKIQYSWLDNILWDQREDYDIGNGSYANIYEDVIVIKSLKFKKYNDPVTFDKKQIIESQWGIVIHSDNGVATVFVPYDLPNRLDLEKKIQYRESEEEKRNNILWEEFFDFSISSKSPEYITDKKWNKIRWTMITISPN